jgi:tRNA-Thr(GGU) m(6)t(6)A37 methyltransferase TsaA
VNNHRASSSSTPCITLEPIGFVRAGPATKVEAARQPRSGAQPAVEQRTQQHVRGASTARIELLPGRNFEHALDDLTSWEYLWVLFWFDRNLGWRPKVLPPRSHSGRKGVFATRSPHRPNPLGLSAVKLERIEGLVLHVSDVDMLDGTPVLDIKPYVAYTDAIPDARSGWLADAASQTSDPIAPFEVLWDLTAAEQAAWIEAHTQLELRARVDATLELGAEPHPYRRIRKTRDGFVLAVKEWRVRFDVDDRRVHVREIASGFRDSQLREPRADLQVHRDFRARYAAARERGDAALD